jgi:hypothetical protein
MNKEGLINLVGTIRFEGDWDKFYEHWKSLGWKEKDIALWYAKEKMKEKIDDAINTKGEKDGTQ